MAAGFAKRLSLEARARGLRADVGDLAHFAPSVSPTSAADVERARASLAAAHGDVHVFLVASYGDGDPTDNAADFMAWVCGSGAAEEAARAAMRGTRVAVFGLGNMQYEHFNRTGRRLNARLDELGCQRVMPYGEGDDDAHMDDDFENWSAALWPALTRLLTEGALGGGSGGSGGAAAAPVPPPVEWYVDELERAPPDGVDGVAASSSDVASAGARADVSARHLFLSTPARVVESRELRQVPARGARTQHIEFELPAASWDTADNVYICPENSVEDVTALAATWALNLAAWVSLRPGYASAQPSPRFPTPCSVRAALTRFLDIRGPLTRDLVAGLAPFASKQSEADALMRASSGAAWPAFRAAHRDVLALSRAFPSIRPPLSALLLSLPPLAPRAYTVASSARVTPQRAAVCVSVLDGGVASTYIASLAVGATAALLVRPSSFKLPAAHTRPMILVGPGTGIAPMRAFILERRDAAARGERVGRTLLFFGCRRADEDFIYKDELTRAAAAGEIELTTAFSREGPSKVYVQHKLEEAGAAVWALLTAGEPAAVYVCGATKMGADVFAAFERVRNFAGAAVTHKLINRMPHPPHPLPPSLSRAEKQLCRTHGNLSLVEATAFLRNYQDKGLYTQELWST